MNTLSSCAVPATCLRCPCRYRTGQGHRGGPHIHILDERALSPRKAAIASGYPYADFSRIRKAALSRFSLDKLVKMLNALDDQTEVVIDFRPGTPLPEAHQTGA